MFLHLENSPPRISTRKLTGAPCQIGLAQFLIKWYGMGKTSVKSRFNLPGRVAWFLMEIPGFMTLLYVMKTLPKVHGIEDLPWQNRVLAGLFVSSRSNELGAHAFSS